MRKRSRPLYLDVHLPAAGRRKRRIFFILLALAAAAAVLIRSALYLRELSEDMVISDVNDLMTLTVNDTVSRKLADSDYGYDYFVSLEFDNSGRVVAVRTNMARINALSAELLSDIVEAAEGGQMRLDIPVGNILGSSLLLGKGPEIPVDITSLTSSRVEFKNELFASGINQTKHQIKLNVIVNVDVILPWKTVSTDVVSEVLVAETVIVGDVPQTYFDME